MTTPGLNVYQLKRSKRVKHYAHVVHATGDATLYRLFGVDYFDSVLLTGDYQAADIRTLEEQRGLPATELVSVGCPYLDILQEKIRSVPSEENHPFTVLVSPSWGTAALLSRYGEKLLDPLVDTGWRIIIRPHPQSKKSESELLTRLESRYKDKANVEWDYERDNIYAMKKSDIMISDFSGIIFDYTFLCDKPVMYSVGQIDLRAYDAYDINQGKDLWQFKMLEKMGIALEESDFGSIRQVIESVKDNPQLAAARKEAKESAWMYQGNAGKEIVDFMVQKAATL